MIKTIFKDKLFFGTFISLTIPIAFQNLMASGLNLVDTVIVGQLGETAIAAVGLANQVFFLLNLLLFGICSGAAIFTAQFWGKQDLQGIRSVLGLNLLLGVSSSLLFMLVSLLIPRQIMGIFSPDPAVIELGSQFLSISALSFVFTSITFAYSFALRSTGYVKLPMVTSIIALTLNTVLNYLLIFGYLGFPAMGVSGSATATVIARTVEVIMILSVVYKERYPVAARLKEMTILSKDFVKRFFKTTTPAILNEVFWSLGITVYTIVYAWMGTEVVAATNIATTVERVSMVLFFGMSHACAVMVGNKIGAREQDTAFQYGKRFLVLGPAIGLMMGGLLILTNSLVLLAFNISPGARVLASHVLILMGLAMFVRVFNFITIVGIFRSGGDTLYALIMETSGVWVIGVPLAILGGRVWGLSLEWVYTLILLEEVYKFLMGLWRFLSKKWIRDLVNT